MCELSEIKIKLSKSFKELRLEKELLGETIHKCDLKTCDLLHVIELSKSRSIKNLYQNFLIINAIREVRKTRRLAKDELEILNIFINNKGQREINFIGVVNKINRKERSLKSRTYSPRIDSFQKIK